MAKREKGSAYAAAGVDIDAQERALVEVRKLARSTFTPGVLSDLGLFGGLFRPDLAGLREPVLVALGEHRGEGHRERDLADGAECGDHDGHGDDETDEGPRPDADRRISPGRRRCVSLLGRES